MMMSRRVMFTCICVLINIHIHTRTQTHTDALDAALRGVGPGALTCPRRSSATCCRGRSSRPSRYDVLVTVAAHHARKVCTGPISDPTTYAAYPTAPHRRDGRRRVQDAHGASAAGAQALRRYHCTCGKPYARTQAVCPSTQPVTPPNIPHAHAHPGAASGGA